MNMRRARRIEHSPFGAQVAFARAAAGLGWMSLGALAVGAVAIGALAIRALAVKRGKIERLEIEELEVGGCASGSSAPSRSKLLPRKVHRDRSVDEPAVHPKKPS